MMHINEGRYSSFFLKKKHLKLSFQIFIKRRPDIILTKILTKKKSLITSILQFSVIK